MNRVMKKLRLQEEQRKSTTLNANQQQLVERYAVWLSTQARRHTTTNTLQEMNEYVESAGKTVLIGKRKIDVFAPFRPEHSALRTITARQAIALIVIAILWEVCLHLFRQGWLVATIAMITALYLSYLLLNIVLTFITLRHKATEQIDERVIHALQHADWPSYTILCPLYREAPVVPQFVRAMKSLDYPTEKLQILLLTEEDDTETRKAIRALALPPHFKIVTVPDGEPRTKPRACNFGLMQATGQYVVIYDAEDIPEALQLKKAVLTFANHGPELACVQARLNFYNPNQNLLTRWFTAEYSLWFDLILPGLQQAGLSIPLGGTSNHFPTQTIRALGAWDAFNVTEDCDLGLRLARYHLETVVLDSTTYEEANSQLKNWIRQRSRWIKGYMQTYLVNMRRPLRYLRPGSFREFLSLQLVIGGKTAFLFLNPLLWFLFVLYIFLRPVVGQVYQDLFPKPLLYISTINLVFGNFFYMYIYLLACLRRKQYRLIKWTLLIPFYWMLMSVAACMALSQLIMAPHYWEKTEHGLHLRKKQPLSPDVPSFAMSQSIEQEPTFLMPAVVNVKEQSSIPSVTTALLKISTLPLPAFSRSEHATLHQPERRSTRDPWLLATLLVACIASVVACWYSFQHHDILLYNDAYSHLRIARRIFDAPSPSFAQFGGVWLPLPHLLMLPFAWNDYLWHTGLAGSFPSMACYLVTTVYLYLAARRLTSDGRASFVGTLVFVLNPNVLYLQTTPLSELVCSATLTMVCYYFLRWTQDDHLKYLIFAAGSTFLATLARYDGWALFLVLLVFIVFIGIIKRHKATQLEGNLVIFAVLGGLGIVIWLIWGAVIFGDPLYFQHGPYSSQQQQVWFLHKNALSLYTYHDLLQSFRYYTLNIIDILGPILFILAALSVVGFVSRQRKKPETFGALVFLTPFAFYIFSLYSGQIVLFVPEAVPAYAQLHLYNARFGAEMVAPVALFIAIFISRWQLPQLPPVWGTLGYTIAMLAITFQAILIASGGIISLQDGQYGVSCAPHHDINTYLAQHYAGGKILEDIYISSIDGTDTGINLMNFVSESSGPLWDAALHDPAAIVDWIIVSPDDGSDLVTQNIHIRSPAFLKNFVLVVQEPTGVELYHRTGLPPLPTRAVPPNLFTEHSLCGAGGA
jgi:cellulose synthase/poly-beta-1,6-N-acetylglucosamine synthase-like glycosyltransferase